jgi:hypothetical protein
VPVASRLSWTARLEHREPGELTIGELAGRLAMPANTVHRWIQRGVVTARKVNVLTQSLWLIQPTRSNSSVCAAGATKPLSARMDLETHHAWQISIHPQHRSRSQRRYVGVIVFRKWPNSSATMRSALSYAKPLRCSSSMRPCT